MAVTSNSRGEIVPGSKVKIRNCDVIYDVGEVNGKIAALYKENKFIKKVSIVELSVI